MYNSNTLNVDSDLYKNIFYDNMNVPPPAAEEVAMKTLFFLLTLIVPSLVCSQQVTAVCNTADWNTILRFF